MSITIKLKYLLKRCISDYKLAYLDSRNQAWRQNNKIYIIYISFKQIVCHDIAMRFFLGNLIWSKQFKNVKQLDLVFCNAMSSNLYYILELQYHLLKYNIIRCLHIQYYCTRTIIIQHCSRSLIKKKPHRV